MAEEVGETQVINLGWIETSWPLLASAILRTCRGAVIKAQLQQSPLVSLTCQEPWPCGMLLGSGMRAHVGLQ